MNGTQWTAISDFHAFSTNRVRLCKIFKQPRLRLSKTLDGTVWRAKHMKDAELSLAALLLEATPIYELRGSVEE